MLHFFGGHCDLDLWPHFQKNCVQSIHVSPTLFEVRIQILVCGCILGWQCVTCHFLVIVILLPFSRIVVTRAYIVFPTFFEVGIPNSVCGCLLEWQSAPYHLWVTVTLTSDLISRIIVSEADLLHYYTPNYTKYI